MDNRLYPEEEKFKIFTGYADRAGRTCAMLKEAYPGRRKIYRESLKRGSLKVNGTDLLKNLLMVVISTIVGMIFYQAGFSEANIIIIYLLGVLVAAMWTGNRFCGALISFISVLAFNFFFTIPRFTLQAYAPSYPVTFAVMFLSSFLANSLVIRIKQQSRQAAEKAYRTGVLLETSRRLQKAENGDVIIDDTAGQIQKLLGFPILFYKMNQDGHLGDPLLFTDPEEKFPEDGLTEDEKAVAEWVYKNNRHAGATTSTLPGANCLFLAVRGQNAVFAVAGIYMGAGIRELDAFDKNLLIAVLNECGLALERQELQEAKKEVELKAQQEQLRANLLRAISHDLRTPLTSISGSAGILMDSPEALDESRKQKLYSDIYDDSMWLISLVENLLAVTRIENGTMNMNVQPELLDEVFREAVKHLDRHASGYVIKVELQDDLMMAQMDVRLIVQVIINLLNNAIKYTPVGSHICLSAEKSGREAVISVSDNGAGITEEAKRRLFEMFYTASNVRGDGRRGLGLGLSLCRSIVEAHGGTIQVFNQVPHGTKFVFTLKIAEVEAYE